jgi:hypothetical protein
MLCSPTILGKEILLATDQMFVPEERLRKRPFGRAKQAHENVL